MPPLEAMASGVPVITSDSTSIPEVAGDAALLVKPGDVDGLANAMADLLADPLSCKKMQERGLEQAKDFQWLTAAEKVRKVYLETLT